MATRKSTTSKSRSKRTAKAEAGGVAEMAPPETTAHHGRSNGAAKSAPTADQIRFRAYEMYLARGGSHGDDWRDWFAAERELSVSLRPS